MKNKLHLVNLFYFLFDKIMLNKQTEQITNEVTYQFTETRLQTIIHEASIWQTFVTKEEILSLEDNELRRLALNRIKSQNTLFARFTKILPNITEVKEEVNYQFTNAEFQKLLDACSKWFVFNTHAETRVLSTPDLRNAALKRIKSIYVLNKV